MKSLKWVFILLIFCGGLLNSASAQNAKVQEKAMEKVEKLNKKIVNADAALSMSDEQKEKASAIFYEGIMKMRAARKGVDGEKAKKEAAQPIAKEMSKSVRQTVLTKEQRMALSKANKQKEKN